MNDTIINDIFKVAQNEDLNVHTKIKMVSFLSRPAMNT
jgi:hypothetical protein